MRVASPHGEAWKRQLDDLPQLRETHVGHSMPSRTSELRATPLSSQAGNFHTMPMNNMGSMRATPPQNGGVHVSEIFLPNPRIETVLSDMPNGILGALPQSRIYTTSPEFYPIGTSDIVMREAEPTTMPRPGRTMTPRPESLLTSHEANRQTTLQVKELYIDKDLADFMNNKFVEFAEVHQLETLMSLLQSASATTVEANLEAQSAAAEAQNAIAEARAATSEASRAAAEARSATAAAMEARTAAAEARTAASAAQIMASAAQAQVTDSPGRMDPSHESTVIQLDSNVRKQCNYVLDGLNALSTKTEERMQNIEANMDFWNEMCDLMYRMGSNPEMQVVQSSNAAPSEEQNRHLQAVLDQSSSEVSQVKDVVYGLDSRLKELEALTVNMAELEKRLAGHHVDTQALVEQVSFQEAKIQETHMLASQGQRRGPGAFAICDRVACCGNDAEVPCWARGTTGTVFGFMVSTKGEQLVQVRFPNGDWDFQPADLLRGELMSMEVVGEPGLEFDDQGRITDVLSSSGAEALRLGVQVGWHLFLIDAAPFSSWALENRIATAAPYRLTLLIKSDEPASLLSQDPMLLDMLDRRALAFVEGQMDMLLVDHLDKLLAALENHKAEVIMALEDHKGQSANEIETLREHHTATRDRSCTEMAALKEHHTSAMDALKMHLLQELGALKPNETEGLMYDEGRKHAERIEVVNLKVDNAIVKFEKDGQDMFARLVNILEFGQRTRIQADDLETPRSSNPTTLEASRADLDSEILKRARDISDLHAKLNREIAAVMAKMQDSTPSNAAAAPLSRTISALAGKVLTPRLPEQQALRRSVYLPIKLDGVRVLKKEAPVVAWRATTEDFSVKPNGDGLGFRKSKDLRDKEQHLDDLVAWGNCIQGIDEGDGWVRCEI